MHPLISFRLGAPYKSRTRQQVVPSRRYQRWQWTRCRQAAILKVLSVPQRRFTYLQLVQKGYSTENLTRPILLRTGCRYIRIPRWWVVVMAFLERPRRSLGAEVA